MTLELASDIGHRIADLRSALGWTQRAFGKKLGRGYKQVIEWEKGRREPPRTGLEELAVAEGWPIEIFTEGGPMPSDVLPRVDPATEAGTFDAEVDHIENLLNVYEQDRKTIQPDAVRGWVRSLKKAHARSVIEQPARVVGRPPRSRRGDSA